MKLNLGSGSSKIPDCINIDVEKSCNPDLVCDFLKDRLPYEDSVIEEIYLFHTIEHIRKIQHNFILSEIWRVLKPNGTFIISFPEFRKCYRNWETNARGQKDFWEATLFGRQLYPSDHHVCIIDSIDFVDKLRNNGFTRFIVKAEPEPNEFNTVIKCEKGSRLPTYEEIVSKNIDSIVFESTK